MPTTSASIVIVAAKRMSVERLFSVGLNVLPVRPVTKPVRTLLRNAAQGLFVPHMCAMAVIKRLITVPLLRNTSIMLVLLKGNIKRFSVIPEPEST
jgi:hypothetical protein